MFNLFRVTGRQVRGGNPQPCSSILTEDDVALITEDGIALCIGGIYTPE